MALQRSCESPRGFRRGTSDGAATSAAAPWEGRPGPEGAAKEDLFAAPSQRTPAGGPGQGVARVQVRVWGGRPLQGTVTVSPAKNAVLPQLAAALLSAEPVRLVAPDLGDVGAMCDLLHLLGADVRRGAAGALTVTARGPLATDAPPSAMARMRASVLVLGPLLARCGRATLAQPGGCAIGRRPIDLHLMAMRAMGATVRERGHLVELRAEGGLRGGDVVLPYPSHTATENALLAAALARGTTRILGAAREPEVQDTAALLAAMGAEVKGAGGPVIVVRGRQALGGARHIPVPDRIEAGTLLLACAAAGGRVRVLGARAQHLGAPLARLRAMGARVEADAAGVTLEAPERARLRPADVRTLPYPGFPTDLQPPMSVLAALAAGPSLVSETVFDARLGHVDGLRRLGADVCVAGTQAWFTGRALLRGAELRALDLRGGAALLLAALAAEGESRVDGFCHVARGYDDLPAKLRLLGAEVLPEEGPPSERGEIAHLVTRP